MAGFALPKFRWLIVGAVAAGIWVTKHDPLESERRVVSQSSRSSPQQNVKLPPRRSPQTAAPQTVKLPTPRPSKIVTSSIRPAERPTFQAFFTASRVRLREKAAGDAAIVGTLEQGTAVTVLEHSDKWRRIAATGRKGWVHGDYLSRTNPAAPRPKQVVAKATKNNPAEKPAFQSWVNRSRMTPLSKRPARPPQHGDCQCPYDLMIDGKQCGDHSAYFMRAGKAECYL